MNYPLPVVAIPRNCFRCGNSFLSGTLSRTCPDCKKPVVRVKKAPTKEMSAREWQIIDMIMVGTPNKDIAFALSLSYGTIKTYLVHVFKKTGTTNRTELAQWAFSKVMAGILCTQLQYFT